MNAYLRHQQERLKSPSSKRSKLEAVLGMDQKEKDDLLLKMLNNVRVAQYQFTQNGEQAPHVFTVPGYHPYGGFQSYYPGNTIPAVPEMMHGLSYPFAPYHPVHGLHRATTMEDSASGTFSVY